MHSSAVTSQVRLNAEDLHQLKWLLGQLISLIAIWALFDLEVLPHGILLGSTFLIYGTLLAPKMVGLLPSFFWKAATAFLVVFIVMDFSMHGIDFLKPMVRMVMMLTLYRALQYRKSREDLQVILLCLFALVVKGVMTVSLLFAFQMLLFTPLAMALLFLINLLETSHQHTLTRADWARFHWTRFIPRLMQGLDFRLLTYAGILFATLVAVSSLIFISIPRFRVEQALPFLQLDRPGKIGFSDTIRFGEVNQLSSDSSVALRVRVPNVNQVPGHPYWRMVVLDEYRNGAFITSGSLKQNRRGYTEGSSIPDRISSRPRDDAWTYYLEGDVSRYLPLLGSYEEIQFSSRTQYRVISETQVITLEQVPNRVFGYIVSGMVPTDSFGISAYDRSILAEQKGPIIHEPVYDEYDEPRAQRIRYPLTTLLVTLNQNDVDFLHSVVQRITDGKPTDARTFSTLAAQWLAENYSYDVQHDAPWDGINDPLLTWMRHSKRGWCEHFTGAFILLCRMAGHPARAVAGFSGATWNDYENYLIINNSHAHAWAEVYDGEGNWFRVDPTPDTTGSFGGIDTSLEATIGLITGWTAWIDSLRMAWYRRIVNFDQTDQHEIASELRSQSKAFYESIKQHISQTFTAIQKLFFSGWDREKVIHALLSLALSCFLFLGLRQLWRWLRQAASRGGLWANLMGGDPIRKQAGRLLQRFQDVSSNNNIPPKEWQIIRDQLLLIRYGPTEERPRHREVFRRARKALRRFHRPTIPPS